MAWRIFLCEKKRHTLKGELQSCFDIWHKSWRNGALVPAPQRGGKRSIRARAPARRPVEDSGAEGGVGCEDASDESTVGDSCQQKRARRATNAAATD
ncbi:hypothetical protein V7S43_010102 [Phytophthora oleae]|uniref:Uncharacterized protein n=1 Tax=Phytophthora oleae TaxID=2107226 RepID=A0ABD3FGE3_9STRA